MPYSAKEVLSKLEKAGFIIKRQSGSHIVLRNNSGHQTYVSMHAKDIATGTFRKILKQAGLTEEEFKKL